MRKEKQRNGIKNSLLQVEIIHHLLWIEFFVNKEREIRKKTEKNLKNILKQKKVWKN